MVTAATFFFVMVDFALDLTFFPNIHMYVDLDTSRQTVARPLVVSVATIAAKKATLPRNALNLVLMTSRRLSCDALATSA